MEKRILGIFIGEKVSEPLKVQYLLSKYGCSIRTRIGLNDTVDELNGGGIILLELTGDLSECNRLEADLQNIEHLEVKKMIFTV